MVSNPTPKNKKGRLPGGLFCFGLVRNPNLFLVYSVNALTTFAWRPSRTAVSFAYSLAPIPPYLRNLTQVYSCWGERVLERDGLEGHRSRSELKKGSRLPPAPRKKAPLGTFFRGAGGSRTLVQTGKPYAFYRLISTWIFEP